MTNNSGELLPAIGLQGQLPEPEKVAVERAPDRSYGLYQKALPAHNDMTGWEPGDQIP